IRIALTGKGLMMARSITGPTWERRGPSVRVHRVLDRRHDAGVLKEVALSSPRPAMSGPIPLPVGFVARTITLGQGTRSLLCPDCSVPLSLFQPDEQEPSRLLGTCDSCSKWVFLVEVEPDWERGLLVELPDAETIRRGLETTEAPPQGRGHS